MEHQRFVEIATMGCCGIIAQIIHRRVYGSTPCIQYGVDGIAQHAGVRVGDRYIHWGGNDDGFVDVSMDELKRVCREEFDPSGLNLGYDEMGYVIRNILNELDIEGLI